MTDQRINQASNGVGIEQRARAAQETAQAAAKNRQVQQRLEDRRNRMRGALFLDRVGAFLHLPRHVVATAKFYVQLFFNTTSFSQHNVHEVAAGALLLAIKTCELLKHFHMSMFRQALASVALSAKTPVDPHSKEARYWHMRAVYYESAVAAALGFEIWLDLPHEALLDLESELNVPEDVLGVAYELCHECMNGALVTTTGVDDLAAAALYFAYMLSGVEPPSQPRADGQPWWARRKLSLGRLRWVGIELFKNRRAYSKGAPAVSAGNSRPSDTT